MASMLRKILGIGDYTSGAIASIAFKEVVPIVDGNVVRVIARLRAISANPKDSVIVKRFCCLLRSHSLITVCFLMLISTTVCLSKYINSSRWKKGIRGCMIRLYYSLLGCYQRGNSEACTVLVQAGKKEELMVTDNTGLTPAQLASDKKSQTSCFFPFRCFITSIF